MQQCSVAFLFALPWPWLILIILIKVYSDENIEYGDGSHDFRQPVRKVHGGKITA
jgi:hypothetical protein